MYHIKISVVFASMLGIVWLTGCATAPSKSETAELQRSAMQRWSACLERNTNANDIPSLQMAKLLKRDCEGYKRDVLALFPLHMSGHVEQMLVSSAYQHIESLASDNQEPEQLGALVQTVLR